MSNKKNYFVNKIVGRTIRVFWNKVKTSYNYLLATNFQDQSCRITFYKYFGYFNNYMKVLFSDKEVLKIQGWRDLLIAWKGFLWIWNKELYEGIEKYIEYVNKVIINFTYEAEETYITLDIDYRNFIYDIVLKVERGELPTYYQPSPNYISKNEKMIFLSNYELCL